MSLKQETIKLSMLTGMSIAGGFVFHILLARSFGVSRELDCFFVILSLFTLLGVFNTFVTALYLPGFNEVKKENFPDSLVFVDVIIKWVTLIAVVIIAGVLWGDDFIIKLLAPGFTGQSIVLAKELNAIIVFALLCYSVSQVLILTLNALYYYTVPALAMLIDPVFNIAAVCLFAPHFGIKSIAFSYLAANLVRVVVLIVYFHRKTGWRPTVRFYHSKVPELIRGSSLMAGNGFLWGLKDVIIRNIASRMGEGAVTLFSYAEKIINTLFQIVVYPLARIFYARVSEWAASGQWDNIRFTIMRTIRVGVSLVLFVCAGGFVFLPSFLRLFFYGSKFTGQDILTLSAVFNILLGHLVLLSFETHLSRVIYATKRIGVVTITVAAGLTILGTTAFVLARKFGVNGLAGSVVFAQSVICFIYYMFTKKKLGLGIVKLGKNLINSFLVAGISVIIGVGMKHYVDGSIQVVVLVLPAWLLIYGLLARLFLKEELHIMVSK
ncbi:MAG: lipid II flippase MurJ [Candidatus Omnitrophica bacterium]|nr:lipid II flippase MurJ [Candidatus Omnitrophota bacterium]